MPLVEDKSQLIAKLEKLLLTSSGIIRRISPPGMKGLLNLVAGSRALQVGRVSLHRHNRPPGLINGGVECLAQPAGGSPTPAVKLFEQFAGSGSTLSPSLRDIIRELPHVFNQRLSAKTVSERDFLCPPQQQFGRSIFCLDRIIVKAIWWPKSEHLPTQPVIQASVVSQVGCLPPVFEDCGKGPHLQPLNQHLGRWELQGLAKQIDPAFSLPHINQGAALFHPRPEAGGPSRLLFGNGPVLLSSSLEARSTSLRACRKASRLFSCRLGCEKIELNQTPTQPLTFFFEPITGQPICPRQHLTVPVLRQSAVYLHQFSLNGNPSRSSSEPGTRCTNKGGDRFGKKFGGGRYSIGIIRRLLSLQPALFHQQEATLQGCF
jgi:hypothetical protein